MEPDPEVDPEDPLAAELEAAGAAATGLDDAADPVPDPEPAESESELSEPEPLSPLEPVSDVLESG